MLLGIGGWRSGRGAGVWGCLAPSPPTPLPLPAGCRFRAVFEVDPPRKIFKIHSPTMAAATPAAFQETLRTQIRETHTAQSPQSSHHVSTATIFSCLARSAAISVTSFFKLNAVQHHCHSARTPSCPRSRNRRMSKQAFITANGISPKC